MHPCRLEGCKNLRGQSWRSIRNCRLCQIRDWCAQSSADLADFFDLQLWPVIFLQSLNLQGCKYFIWKIWFISVWRTKAKVIAWLFIWFIFAQRTLISYHTEVFVKTEVACTVYVMNIQILLLHHPIIIFEPINTVHLVFNFINYFLYSEKTVTPFVSKILIYQYLQ